MSTIALSPWTCIKPWRQKRKHQDEPSAKLLEKKKFLHHFQLLMLSSKTNFFSTKVVSHLLQTMRNSGAIPNFPVFIHESYGSEFRGASPAYINAWEIIAWMTDTHPRCLGCGICVRFSCFLESFMNSFWLTSSVNPTVSSKERNVLHSQFA